MKLLKIHRNFLINKISLILLICVVLIGVIVNLAGILSLNNEYTWFDKGIMFKEYLNSYLLYFKLIIINVICYLWGSSFTNDNDMYHLLITGFKKIKIKYIISKILFLLIISFIIIFFNFYLMSLFGILCSNFFIINKIIIRLFVNVFLISIIYGLLSSFLTIILNNNYASFVASGLFVLGEIISDSDNIFRIYFVFFPNISLDSGSSFGVIHLFFLFIIYLFLVIFSFDYKK